MRIFGLSFNFHDSAAAFVQNGEIINAVQEERFTRIKHDPSFPLNSVNYILETNNIKDINEFDKIVYYENPKLKINRIISSLVATFPKGFQNLYELIDKMSLDKFNPVNQIKKRLNYNQKVKIVDHHLSHAASSFFPSPFKEASILVIDGVGEWDTTSIGLASGNSINLQEHLKFPHSLGLLYSAITYFLGFKVNSGEYKVMGLAPYGEPKYKDIFLNDLMDIKNDGSFKLNLNYFDHQIGGKPINEKFETLFKRHKRKPESKIEQFDMDMASSVQFITELVIQKIVKHNIKKNDCKNLCLSGGVALNCVSNGKLLDSKFVKNLWVQPAAGDAGGALGAALYESYVNQNFKRKKLKRNQVDFQKGSYLGPSFDTKDIEEYLKAIHVPYIKPKTWKKKYQIC